MTRPGNSPNSSGEVASTVSSRVASRVASGFVLDRFQVEAIRHLDAGRSVLVSAPTGSGKTVVAEHAIDRALADGRRAFYTTPIKALSNQKFHELSKRFGAARTGLLTGDNTINGAADVVVMTTEVLRNMLYSGAQLDRLAVVVLDEVHYLEDTYRGPVWEEVILHLPLAVRLVCLSATVSNHDELGGWLNEVRGTTAVVVETTRPVELTNLYAVGERRRNDLHVLPVLVDGVPNRQGHRFDAELRLGRRRQRGQRRTQPWRTPNRPALVADLQSRGLLPAIWFIFSRRGCDEAADRLLGAGIRLTDASEAARIRALADSRLAGLERADRATLGASRWVAALERGVAAHHAGLVPAFKEAVELCFAEGLVKLVFATETLALGVNMPARSVLIDQLSKFNGDTHEQLSAAQFTQITGRSGRRGIDDVGYAVVPWSPFARFEQVAALASSRSFRLQSAFRPTYNMTVNLLTRLDPNEARRLLERSFAQYQADRLAKPAEPGWAEPGWEEKALARPQPIRPGRTKPKQNTGRAGAGDGSATLAQQFDAIAAALHERGHLATWCPTEVGAMVARVYHEADLLVVEALTNRLLDDLSVAEMASLVSTFSYEHRSPAPAPAPEFDSEQAGRRFQQLAWLIDDLNDCERRHGVSETRQPEAGLAVASHAWAGGCDFGDVIGDELSAGDFVRNMKQLLDLLHQIADVAPDPATANTARLAARAVNRGVVASSGVMDGQ